MTDNNYVIKLNDEDNFDLYTNGVLTLTSTFIGGLLVAIATREGVTVPTFGWESHLLAVLLEAGVNVDVEGW